MNFNDFLGESVFKYQDLAKKAMEFIIKELKIKSKVKLESMNFGLGYKGQGGAYEKDGYRIVINFNTTEVALVRTIAHELIHIKQMEDLRLIHHPDHSIEFNGVRYDREHYDKRHGEEGESEEFPFEMEAYDNERKLEAKFRKKYKLY